MAALTQLSAVGLSRHFGGLRAVDDVSLELPQGEVRAIIGPNGAGKSTLVGLICGRILPTAGRIVFEGRDITDLPAHRRVGLGIAYTFQITSIFGNLSVLDNVALAVQSSLGRSRGSILRLDAREMQRRVGAALDRVGLAVRRDAKASTLAYGHQRLLEVAMGLALAPKLLILDEPTQGLSDAEIAGFCDLTRSIAREATVLLIEHNMDVVMELAQRITVMSNGAILSEGTPAEIRADAAVQRAYLGA
ncbi:MAG TPA: ABC transporter ATP-binding protein [Hyphomicrobiaceae bacterium]|jgi:branched-chain amino acid transport system ATP-binding protein|nr:ABC transporter ATP-binding protein [Hyphomicrobiaceae bacterium]